MQERDLMPKGYIFDTVACSRWRRGDMELRSKVEALSSDASLYTSVISVGELILGIHKAPSRGLILITNDPDFDQVLGLQKENWLE